MAVSAPTHVLPDTEINNTITNSDYSVMVDYNNRVDGGNMCFDNNSRRSGFPSIKFRLREERKKVVLISSAKYHNIDDHETGMRRFCLISNTLQRLQREAREEKLARHKARANNVSPSYLSASRCRSPSPPCDMEVADVLSTYGQPAPSPITALSDDEDELFPCKRPRLCVDDDNENEKENSCENRLIDVVGDMDEINSMDDTQDILREVYESYTGESLSQSQPSSLPNQSDTPYSTLCCSTNNQWSNESSLETNSQTSLSCNKILNTCSNNLYNGACLSISGYMEWSRPHQQYPCSHSALLGNDLQSVVYQSLITSL